MGQRTPQRNFIQIPLNGGIETRIDPSQVQPPKLLQQVNFSARSTGALTARYGATTMSATLGLQDAATVDATNDELVGLDSTGLYAYNPSVNQFIRRGDYTDFGLSVQNVINQTVNQNYTPNQAGGVRNLSTAVIGNVGILVWDTGSVYATTVNPTGGVVYMTCYDAASGKVYWSTTLAGYTPTDPGSVLANGYLGVSAFSAGSVLGVMQPTVLSHSGKFIVGMVTCTDSTTSLTLSGTTTTGYGYIGNLFSMTPNASTGIPPQPIMTGLANTNLINMFSQAPVSITAANSSLSSSNAAGLELTNNYYDVVSNGVDLTYVGSYASINSSNALVYGNPSVAYYGWSNPTIGPAMTSSTSILPTQNGTAATAAHPIALASVANNTMASVFTPWGVFGVSTYSAGASRGTFFGPSVSYTGKQNNTTPQLSGIAGWPVACTMTGTSTNFTAIMTDGYLVNSFNFSANVFGPAIESYINLPMTSTRQIPVGPGRYQSTVASRLFWIPAAGSPRGSGALEPAVWLYVASPISLLAAGAYPGGVRPPGQGGGFNSFTNLVLARINLAAFNASKQNVNLSEVAARCMYLKAVPVRYGTMRPPNVVVYNSGYVVPAMQLANIADSVVATKLVTVRSGQLRNVIALPQGALLTGADTRYYDGFTIRSAGWIRIPELSGVGNNLSVSTSGGSLAPNFTYTYFFVYIEYDNYGNAIYSSPSPPYSVTTTSSSTCSVVMDVNEFWPPSSKNNTVQAGVQIFRNTSLNPLQFFRVAQVPSPGATAQYGQQFYTDTSADDISGNALLYSPPNGGELPNDPPPPSTYAVATKQRVYVASAENGSYLFPSKPFYSGRAPVEFNAAQYVDIDPSTGPINGLASLDSTVVVFKQKAIYLLSGDGPDATGVGSFNNPYRLSVDVGLQDPQSIVSTERGVFFRSQRGIELLDRGGASVTYVGAPVEGTLGGNVVTDAFIVPDQSQVRFAFVDTSAQAYNIVYDYVSQIWYSYLISPLVYGSTYVGLTGKSFNGSTYAGVTAVNNVGAVLQEVSGTYADNGAAVSYRLQTPYIPMSQNMYGWGRIRRLNIVGNAGAPFILNVTFLYDYNGAKAKSVAPITISSTGTYRIRIRAPLQVCRAVSIILAAQPTSGSLQGPTISSLDLETSIKSGATHEPDTGSF